MGHYDHPTRHTYVFPALAFGAGGSTSTIKPPRGLNNGRIEEIHASVTATFTAVTTPAFIRIGYAADLDYYAELNMGTAAINTGYGTRDIALPTQVIFRTIDMVNDPVPGALAAVTVTFVAATGGSPAGTATVTVNIGWW